MFKNIGNALSRHSNPDLVVNALRTTREVHQQINHILSLPPTQHFASICHETAMAMHEQSFSADLDTHVRYALQEGSRFCLELGRLNQNYSLDWQNRPSGNNKPQAFSQLVRAAHRDFLIDETASRVEDNPKLGLLLDNHSRDLLQKRSPLFARDLQSQKQADTGLNAPPGGQASPESTLTGPEMLALVDYVHPHTGTFAAVTMARRAEVYGNTLPARRLAALLTPLELATEKLSTHPEFAGNPDTLLYKGLELSSDGLRLFKQVCESNGHYTFGHVLSCTPSPEGVFGPARGKNAVCLIQGVPHARVSEFHPEKTHYQQESLIPSKLTRRLQLQSAQSIPKDQLAPLLEEHAFDIDHIFKATSPAGEDTQKPEDRQPLKDR